MYSYKPLKTLQIKNFRNLGDVSIDFSESPIVSLIGENESGKTSIVKAFSVLALHANPRDQKYFIRDGTKAFGIKLTLEDGTIIERVKDNTYNRYSIYHPTGEVEDIRLSGDSTIPSKVQNIMGMVTEPETKEFLHIRTYEDQLLFVVTTASANYKMMHEALKIDQLTRASKLGTQEVNTLKNTVSENEIKSEALNSSLRQIPICNIEALKSIREQLQINLGLLDTIESAVKIIHRQAEIQTELGQYDLIRRKGLKSIDESVVYIISDVGRLLNSRINLVSKQNILSKITALNPVDTVLIERLSEGIRLKKSIEQKRQLAGSMMDIKPEHFIDEVLVTQLESAMIEKKKLNRLAYILNWLNASGIHQLDTVDTEIVRRIMEAIEYKNKTAALKNELGPILNYIEQMKQYIASITTISVECPNCNETVSVNIGDLLG